MRKESKTKNHVSTISGFEFIWQYFYVDNLRVFTGSFRDITDLASTLSSRLEEIGELRPSLVYFNGVNAPYREFNIPSMVLTIGCVVDGIMLVDNYRMKYIYPTQKIVGLINHNGELFYMSDNHLLMRPDFNFRMKL